MLRDLATWVGNATRRIGSSRLRLVRYERLPQMRAGDVIGAGHFRALCPSPPSHHSHVNTVEQAIGLSGFAFTSRCHQLYE